MKNNANIVMLCFGAAAITMLISCGGNGEKADAYGNFETESTVISAETSGKIIFMPVEDGKQIRKGDTIAVVDTAILVLQRKQLITQKDAVRVKFDNIINQVAVAEEQLSSLLKEQQRVADLLKNNVATQKQYDDITSQVNVSRKQIESLKSQNAGVFAELDVIDTQIAILNEQLQRSVIISPLNGVPFFCIAECRLTCFKVYLVYVGTVFKKGFDYFCMTVL